jgi:DnaA N-terminal domain
MARREDIVNTFWDEVDHLSDDAVMLYIWSWTNTKAGMAGIYRVARRKLVEGRFDEDRLTAALVELEEDGKLLYKDGVLWCVARVKRLSSIHEKIAISIAKDLGEIDAGHPLLQGFVEKYGSHPNLEDLLTLYRPSPEGPQDPSPEPDPRPSGDPQERVLGRGSGNGRGRGEGKSSRPKVNRKPVTDDEMALAEQIIAAFNAAAGTQVTTEAHLIPVVGRIREKADLTAEQHRAIIAAVFLDPWWKGPPGPQVIYGNAAQFERSIEMWRAAPAAKLRVVGPPVDPAEYRAGLSDLAAAWPAVLDRLRASVPENTFRLWIEPLQPAGAKGDTVYLAAPEGIRAWAERRYASLIAESLADAGQGWKRVSFSGECPPEDKGQAAA